MSSKIRLWKLGDLKNNIYPTRETIERLMSLIENKNTTEEVLDIVWDSAISVEIIDGDIDFVRRVENMNQIDRIFQEIQIERDYQDEKWGKEFDDKNTINDWGTYINIYLAKATNIGISKEEQRKQMIKVASLAVAALETFDRNNGFPPRHYDKE